MEELMYRYTFPSLLTALLFILASPGTIQPAMAALAFVDEFNNTNLDLTKWTVVNGEPSIANGKLMLVGGVSTRAEIQSIQKFGSGVLQIVITSSNWKPQSQTTDADFGFEIWQGTNGNCHYGVILVANGHLGLLRHQPDATGNCQGDPQFQVYKPISNWDAIRAGKTVQVTLIWSPKIVRLYVSSINSNNGSAVYLGSTGITNQLKIRLNTDFNETYSIDYIRVGILLSR